LLTIDNANYVWIKFSHVVVEVADSGLGFGHPGAI